MGVHSSWRKGLGVDTRWTLPRKSSATPTPSPTQSSTVFQVSRPRTIALYSGMRIRIQSDPLIFGLPDPDPGLYSSDPDPICNSGYKKLFSSSIKNKPESTNSSLMLWFIKSNFMPAYLIYKYTFYFELRSNPEPGSDPIFFPAESRKKVTVPHPC